MSVVDMTAAVKNCKILIVLISDEFERDSKCHDLFLYAKETMNKDIIIVVLGESLEWENKHLGMKIGKQEVCLLSCIELGLFRKIKCKTLLLLF